MVSARYLSNVNYSPLGEVNILEIRGASLAEIQKFPQFRTPYTFCPAENNEVPEDCRVTRFLVDSREDAKILLGKLQNIISVSPNLD
jgi:hypothetical protein